MALSGLSIVLSYALMTKSQYKIGGKRGLIQDVKDSLLVNVPSYSVLFYNKIFLCLQLFIFSFIKINFY